MPYHAVLTSETATPPGGEPIEEISHAIETPIQEGAESVKVSTPPRPAYGYSLHLNVSSP